MVRPVPKMTLTLGNAAVVKLNSVAACGTDLTVIRSDAVTREPIRSTATAADYAAELGPGDTVVTVAVDSRLKCLSGDRHR